jgi:tetratricopeptide (TPR) repeat protein
MSNVRKNIIKKLFILLILTAFLSIHAAAAETKILYLSPEKAKQELQMLLPQYEENQQDAKLLQQIGLCYHSIGEAGDADAVVRSIEFLEKAAKLQPNDNEIKAWLGSATSMRARDAVFWEKMNYSNQGIALMDAAMSAEPDNISIRIIRGNNYLNAPSFLGKDGTAVSDLEFAASKLHGSDNKELLQEIHYKLGLAYKKVNNATKAKENFKLAIELLPDTEVAHKIAKEEHL